MHFGARIGRVTVLKGGVECNDRNLKESMRGMQFVEHRIFNTYRGTARPDGSHHSYSLLNVGSQASERRGFRGAARTVIDPESSAPITSYKHMTMKIEREVLASVGSYGMCALQLSCSFDSGHSRHHKEHIHHVCSR